MNKTVGIKADVLKHTSISFLKGTLIDFLMYSSQLLRFSDNSSSVRRYSLNVLLLVVAFFMLVIMTIYVLQCCSSQFVFCVYERSM